MVEAILVDDTPRSRRVLVNMRLEGILLPFQFLDLLLADLIRGQLILKLLMGEIE